MMNRTSVVLSIVALMLGMSGCASKPCRTNGKETSCSYCVHSSQETVKNCPCDCHKSSKEVAR
jgi:uncharacterized protein YceK